MLCCSLVLYIFRLKNKFVVIFVFYSILPALYTRFSETFRVGQGIHEMTMAYPGGTGELLIMQFAALCFMLVAANCHFQHGNAAWPSQGRMEPRWRRVFPASVALTVLGVAIIVANRHIAAVGDVLSAGIGREILDAQAPLLSFCLATLAYIATDRFRAVVLFAMAIFQDLKEGEFDLLCEGLEAKVIKDK